MIRQKAAKLSRGSSNIVWRSHEPSRLETFSDAVFAFALTLIIVSVEVPKSFDDLLETMKGTVSFAVCFAALFQIWNSQNIFFQALWHEGRQNGNVKCLPDVRGADICLPFEIFIDIVVPSS